MTTAAPKPECPFMTDPSANTKALSKSATTRQDDLRAASDKLNEVRAEYIEQMAEIRFAHSRELDKAEADRLNSIRQVDREEVTKQAAQALTAIQTLASQQTVSAETLRTQVATTAQATAAQLATTTAEITKRISALELALSEGKGKQAVADPAMAEMINEMKRYMSSAERRTGKDQGVGMIAAVGASVLSILIAAGSLIFALTKSDAPAPQQQSAPNYYSGEGYSGGRNPQTATTSTAVSR